MGPEDMMRVYDVRSCLINPRVRVHPAFTAFDECKAFLLQPGCDHPAIPGLCFKFCKLAVLQPVDGVGGEHILRVLHLGVLGPLAEPLRACMPCMQACRRCNPDSVIRCNLDGLRACRAQRACKDHGRIQARRRSTPRRACPQRRFSLRSSHRALPLTCMPTPKFKQCMVHIFILLWCQPGREHKGFKRSDVLMLAM